MYYVYNASEQEYYDIEQYLIALAADETGNTYRLIFLINISELFEKVKRNSSIRGRHTKDPQTGKSLLDIYQMTDDELEFFKDNLRIGSLELFNHISGYSKHIDSAFRFDVSFGTPIITSVVDSVLGAVLTDAAQAMTPDAHIGRKVVITSAGPLENQERVITDNDATTITLASAFDGDITGLDYIVTAQTDKYIIFYTSHSNLDWDLNRIQGIDSAIERALISHALREWYLVNRIMDDYQIEEKFYKEAISSLRMGFFQNGISSNRATPFFNDDDSDSVTTP